MFWLAAPPEPLRQNDEKPLPGTVPCGGFAVQGLIQQSALRAHSILCLVPRAAVRTG